MATAGYGLSFTFPGFTGAIKSWSKDETCGTHESTCSTSNGYQEFIPTVKGWTVSVTMDWQADQTLKPGDEGEVVLQYLSGTTVSGQAIVIGMPESEEVTGAISAEVSLQGTGAWLA